MLVVFQHYPFAKFEVHVYQTVRCSVVQTAGNV